MDIAGHYISSVYISVNKNGRLFAMCINKQLRTDVAFHHTCKTTQVYRNSPVDSQRDDASVPTCGYPEA